MAWDESQTRRRVSGGKFVLPTGVTTSPPIQVRGPMTVDVLVAGGDLASTFDVEFTNAELPNYNFSTDSYFGTAVSWSSAPTATEGLGHLARGYTEFPTRWMRVVRAAGTAAATFEFDFAQA